MTPMRAALQAAGAAALWLFLTGTPPALAASDGQGARALDGAVFALTSGETVRLAGVLAPRGEETAAEPARAALDRLIAGRSVTLERAREGEDRRGRIVAQASVEGDGGEPLWLQGELLRAGWLRVATTAQTDERAGEMLAIEAEARAAGAGAGLWAEPDYAVLTPDPYALAQRLDTFQIVEGIVVSAAETRDFTYLNFGLDYRTDFTVSIARRDLDDLQDEGLDPLSLEGARIRVRGYVHAINGPMIDVDHAAQIEVLD